MITLHKWLKVISSLEKALTLWIDVKTHIVGGNSISSLK